MRTTSGFNQSLTNGFSSKPELTTDSWWLDKDPPAFYAEAKRRHPEMARKWGSAPVTTSAPMDAGLSERFWRHKQHAQQQIDRVSA